MMPTLISRRVRRAAFTTTTAAAVIALGLTGCATGSGDAAGDESDSGTVTLVVHDSFPNDEFEAAASAATGFDVQVVSAGDGGELTNKLVLTKGAPIADAFFGVDNIFASRLIENDVVVEHEPENMPANAEQFAVDGDPDSGLVAVDHGATCINIDTVWFADQQLAAPTTYDDLTKPEYRDLTVLLDPTASSTGASFLVGTVAEFGEDGFADYWQRLVDNGARIEQGWSDAYYGQFTQGGENGTKPIVVSYASSPAFTVDDAGTSSSTAALLDTCTRQVEYAGVLKGAENEAGARAVVDYLVSHEFQQTIPDAMFMNPIDDSVELPAAWTQFAPSPAAGQTRDLGSSEIDSGREEWLKALSDQIGL